MKRLKCSWAITALASILPIVGATPSSPKGFAEAGPSSPHVVFILADDMGYGDWEGGNPDSKIRTPHLNRLAQEGLTFTDGHSASTVCTPSRYGLLTGINPAREGITNTLLKFGKPIIRKGTPTVASFLREHGYATRMVGKWHLGFHMDMSGGRAAFDFTKPFIGGPLDFGFDSYFGTNKAPSGPPHFYIRDRSAVAEPTGTIGRKPGVTNRAETWLPGPVAPGFVHEEVLPSLLEESLKLIRDHAAHQKDKPLFLYLSLTAPHTPWVPSKAFQGRSEAGVYGDFVEEIDDLVGKVNAALKEGGMEKDTLIIFSSDNGAMNVKEAEKANRIHLSNGVLRGGKAHPYEGGHRVPFIAKWPAVVSASSVTAAPVNHTDLFATLIEILGVGDSKKDKLLAGAIDSHSFLPALRNTGGKFERPPMFNNNSTCRIGDWKIVVSRKALTGGDAPDKSFVELYNLKEDLSETTDVSAESPERLEALVKRYTKFKSQWTPRPEAVQLRTEKAAKARRQQPKKRTPAAKPPEPTAEADANVTEAQETRIAALEAEYRPKVSDLRRRQAMVLTTEQTQARAGAKKKAQEEGKKGAGLRAAADAAVKLTDEQSVQMKQTLVDCLIK